MTATQARRAMGARAELENQLLLLELAGRAPARRSCSSEKMCYHRSLNWQSERRSRLVALSPHTRVDLLGPQLERSIAGGGRPCQSP